MRAQRWSKGSASMLVLWLGACTAAEPDRDEELGSEARSYTLQQTINGEEVDRLYTVHTPLDWQGTTDLPLLFGFHGGGGRGDYFVEDFDETMRSETFIGVYPQALEDGWNSSFDPAGPDDIGFTLAILDALEGTTGLDTSHPVAFGYSNGAKFVHTLPLATDRFSSISAMASQLVDEGQPQPGDAHVSVLQLHGTEDDVIEYGGSLGSSGDDPAFLPAEESAAVWAAHNGCSEAPTGRYTRMEWPDCSTGTRVVHYRLEGVGHDIPWDVETDTFATIVAFLVGTRP